MNDAIMTFRPLAHTDLPTLGRWLAAPHVRQWWHEDPAPEAVFARYGPAIDGTDPTEMFVVQLDGRPVGLIQRYRFSDNAEWLAALQPAGAEPEAVGIDYFIGEASLTGHGFGARIIEAFLDTIWDVYPQAPAVVVSVNEGNRASWRVLEKVGFERDWTGHINSDDPSDAGTSHVYRRARPVSRRSGADASDESDSVIPYGDHGV